MGEKSIGRLGGGEVALQKCFPPPGLGCGRHGSAVTFRDRVHDREPKPSAVGLSLAALLVVFLLLYQEFGSARAAGLVLVNLPLALTGGVAALFLFLDETLDIAAMVGFVTLFGIAVRNGILLVSHYLNLLANDASLREAVVQGSMERLNPILMTALTAGLALIPLALGGGSPERRFKRPWPS